MPERDIIADGEQRVHLCAHLRRARRGGCFHAPHLIPAVLQILACSFVPFRVQGNQNRFRLGILAAQHQVNRLVESPHFDGRNPVECVKFARALLIGLKRRLIVARAFRSPPIQIVRQHLHRGNGRFARRTDDALIKRCRHVRQHQQTHRALRRVKIAVIQRNQHRAVQSHSGCGFAAHALQLADAVLQRIGAALSALGERQFINICFYLRDDGNPQHFLRTGDG